MLILETFNYKLTDEKFFQNIKEQNLEENLNTEPSLKDFGIRNNIHVAV